MSNKKEFYQLSIALTKLKSALVTTKKGNKALLIPIDENYLTLKDEAVYMQTSIILNGYKDEEYNTWGFAAQRLPADKYNELGPEMAKDLKLPIIGNLFKFESTNNDDAGGTDETFDDEESDGLPF